MNNNKITVTVLSSFLGAGKITILNNIPNNRENKKWHTCKFLCKPCKIKIF